jgi:hypothetical protein
MDNVKCYLDSDGAVPEIETILRSPVDWHLNSNDLRKKFTALK